MPPKWSKCRCETITMTGSSDNQIGIILLVVARLTNCECPLPQILNREIVVHHPSLGNFPRCAINNCVRLEPHRHLAVKVRRKPRSKNEPQQDHANHNHCCTSCSSAPAGRAAAQ